MTETVRLLAVSRESTVLRPLWSIADSNSWHVESAVSVWDAMERVQSGVAPHMLLLDLPRGDGDSLHILRWLRRLCPGLPVIVICFPEDTGREREATRLGAHEVLIRPFDETRLESAIQRHLVSPESEQANIASDDIEPLGEDEFFVSASPLMQKLRAQVELLAQADVPVLILGEKGSGKDTAGRLIHKLSVRSGFRFQRVNCAALPGDLLEKELFAVGTTASGPTHPTHGKFEIADKGTILISDLTEMPNHLQARLLELLQNRCYTRVGGGDTMLRTDVRILASTSANIERALAEKKLREDLYYRLSDVTLHVPPLRRRKEEVRVLLRHFMHCQAKHYGLPSREFSAQVFDACESYSWPGNLAELKTFVKRYLVAGDSDAVLNDLDPTHHVGTDSERGAHLLSGVNANGIELAEAGPKSLKSLIHDIKSETEKSAIGVALERTGWNRKAAARLLKVSYRSLLYKIEQYHLKSPESFLSPLPGGQMSGAGTKGKVS